MSVLPAIQRSPVTVTTDTACGATRWNKYVDDHKQGIFFHLSGWGEAVKSAYNYDTHYLIAERDGELVGVLALIEARSPLLGASLVSTAFSVGGGPLANDKETLDSLLNEAVRLGESRRVRYIECRSNFVADNWRSKTGLHAGFETALIRDEAQALAAIPRKRRAEIRKALDAATTGGLSIRHNGEPELFYDLYAQSLHRLGTPVFPKRFLDALLAVFAQNTEISIVEQNGAALAALVTFYFKDVAHIIG